MTPITPDDIYKQELTKVMREITQDPTLTINFQTGALSQHVPNNNQAKSSVVSATISSATLFGRTLNQKGVGIIFENVSRQTAYSAVLTVMNNAISQGSDSIFRLINL